MKITLKKATEQICRGGIVAIPTETVYGLGVSLKFPRSVKTVFKLKGRPQDNPLIVHIGTLSQLKDLVKKVPSSFSRVKKFWPGPLTVVFDANLKTVPSAVRSGLKTVAVRMPDHMLLRKLLKKTGPLAAPSANISGKPSPTCVKHVEDDIGVHFPILDGGACRHGVESTVILLKEKSWELLRAGFVCREDLEQALGLPATKQNQGTKPRSPGQKYRHYAPKAKLVLCFSKKELRHKSVQKKYQAVLGFDDTDNRLPLVSLGKRNRFQSNLKRLYSCLRRLDDRGYRFVLVDCDHQVSGLGFTLRERMEKIRG